MLSLEPMVFPVRLFVSTTLQSTFLFDSSSSQKWIRIANTKNRKDTISRKSNKILKTIKLLILILRKEAENGYQILFLIGDKTSFLSSWWKMNGKEIFCYNHFEDSGTSRNRCYRIRNKTQTRNFENSWENYSFSKENVKHFWLLGKKFVRKTFKIMKLKKNKNKTHSIQKSSRNKDLFLLHP